MVKILILKALVLEIKKRFSKSEANKIIDNMYNLETSPNKGKSLGPVGGILIKEIKYRNFRFFFITDGHKLKLMTEESLASLLIKFVRMSDKKEQQKTIDEIKTILKKIGFERFS